MTSQDFKRFLTEVTASARAGTVDVRIVGATCNAIGKILKIQEMEFKYGHRTAKGVAVSRTLNMLA